MNSTSAPTSRMASRSSKNGKTRTPLTSTAPHPTSRTSSTTCVRVSSSVSKLSCTKRYCPDPMELDQIKTPALLVDLDAMEANLRDMASFFVGRPCKLRPHFKNHKTPMLAWKQIRAGAIGIACATLREAEILVEHGVDSILIANEIAGQEKPQRVAELGHYASLMVCVDNCQSIRDLAAAQR